MRIPLVSTRVARVSALVLSATAFACGGSGSSASTVTGPPPPPPVASGSTTSLMVTNNHYSPVTDSVAVGAMLTWTWNSCTGDGYGGSMCTSHSVKFDDGPASVIQSSGEFSRMFAQAGTYTYHCAVHGTAMSGTIVVH
jgi:plastocyanin